MTFAELQTEVQDRGFHHVSETRIARWINQAYLEICHKQDWPFRETTATGTAPLTISDLGKVLWVVDSTNDQPLRGGLDARRVQEMDPDLTATGNPARWYLTGSDTLRVWPTNATVSVTVHYLSKPTELSGEDEPLVPSEFQNLIVDGAVIRAYRNADESDKAKGLRADWNEEMATMYEALLSRDRQTPFTIEDTAPAGMRGA